MYSRLYFTKKKRQRSVLIKKMDWHLLAPNVNRTEREREEEKKVSSRANVLSEFGYNCKIQSNQIVQNATSILVNFLTVIP